MDFSVTDNKAMVVSETFRVSHLLTAGTDSLFLNLASNVFTRTGTRINSDLFRILESIADFGESLTLQQGEGNILLSVSQSQVLRFEVDASDTGAPVVGVEAALE